MRAGFVLWDDSADVDMMHASVGRTGYHAPSREETYAEFALKTCISRSTSVVVLRGKKAVLFGQQGLTIPKQRTHQRLDQ